MTVLDAARPGDQGAHGPAGGLVSPGPAAGPAAGGSRGRGAPAGSGSAAQIDLAAARRVLDVADAAGLQGDLAHQQQSTAAGLRRGPSPAPWAGRGGCPPRTPAPTRAPTATSTASSGESSAACRTALVTSSETISSSPCTRSSVERHALAGQQIPYGVPGLRDRDVDRGSGESPDALVRQRPGFGRRASPGRLRAWTAPAPCRPSSGPHPRARLSPHVECW